MASTARNCFDPSRDALPEDGFTLQLGPERRTDGGFTEVIDVPLP